MYLKHLSLTNFRNYARLELDFPTRVIILQGGNAQGKTNLLEAIYYLAITRTPYADSDRQLINWLAAQEEIPFARLDVLIECVGGPRHIEITLMQTMEPRQGSTSPSLRRSFKLDGVSKRAIDIVGSLQVVLFVPEEIDLVAGPPSRRRSYLDAAISQIDAYYCRNLREYNNVLTQRNALLRMLRDGGEDPVQLEFWDQKLVQWGCYLIARRRQILGRLNQLAETIHAELTGGTEHLRLVYEPALSLQSTSELEAALSLGLGLHSTVSREDVDRIEGALAAQLVQTRAQDIARGTTLIGPHRDEVRFLADGIDMRTYGSRGQQRTTALALKLAEVEIMREETGEAPILLLDDVLSELDKARRDYLLRRIGGSEQAIVTTTDLQFYPDDFLDFAVLWTVQHGCIRPVASATGDNSL